MYQLILTVLIRHEYYEDGECQDIKLTPKKQCSELLKRRGIHYLEMGDGKYSFVSENPTPLCKEDKIELTMDITSSLFQEYTLETAENHKVITIPVSKFEENKGDNKNQMIIQFHSLSKKIEYIIFDKYQKFNFKTYILEDLSNKIKFEEKGDIDLGGQIGKSFISTEPIKLTKTSRQIFYLYGEHENGRKTLLNRNIALPQVGANYTRETDSIQSLIFV